MFDAIVVGSGPAGVMTAFQLRPLRILVLDVGNRPGEICLPQENLYDLRQQGTDLLNTLIGKEFESLNNLERPYLSPKLKGPLWKFLTRRPSCLPDDEQNGFEAVQSFACGGLANAWGAGLLRYGKRDLEGFPVGPEELSDFYDVMTEHIGINGAVDGLTDYLGGASGLLPPMPLTPLAKLMFSRYQQYYEHFDSRFVTVGNNRTAILTAAHRGRPAYNALAQDFFQPNLRAIYHPGMTLDEMISAGEITYKHSHLVKRFSNTERNSVLVEAVDLQTQTTVTFEAERLFLAAGAINSARIVLQSRGDYLTRLPLLDNPISFIPLICPRMIGSPLPVHSFLGGELLVLTHDPTLPSVQSSFYGLAAPLRTDLLTEFPLPFRSQLTFSKYLLPGLAMLQVFHPDEPSQENYLSLKPDGTLSINYRLQKRVPVESHLIRAFRKIGFYSTPSLIRYPGPGSSIHYAGTLPMHDRPGPYQTDREGRLTGFQNVFVTDASTFPRLPSKNHSFTMMANAMRIAKLSQSNLRSSPNQILATG